LRQIGPRGTIEEAAAPEEGTTTPEEATTTEEAAITDATELADTVLPAGVTEGINDLE
jgi:hypothetical protein